MEVHRVKAVRFSFPPGKEEDKPKENQKVTPGVQEDTETLRESDIESGRIGSQQCLARKQREQGMKEKGKKRDYLCGLCSSKRPAASVWNCDGEILPHAEILCR